MPADVRQTAPAANGPWPERLGAEQRYVGAVTLLQFIEELPASDRRLVVVNRTEPRQVTELLSATFPERDVPLEETADDTAEEDEVVLLGDDGVLARSPLSALEYQLLFVNSDIYRTGTTDLENVSLPDVLLAMDEVPFHLRGYPESDREKLILIAISRLIERHAWEVGDGTLRASFQQLSRIEDETGTREVYDRIADTNVDVHLYGVGDEFPDPSLRTVVHAGETESFRRSWFVLFDPPTNGGDPMGMLAYEVEPRRWRGFWTYDPVRLQRIVRYVERKL